MNLRRLGHILALLVLALPVANVPLRAQDSVETEQRRRLEEVRRQADEKRRAAAALKPKETRALGELRRTDKELSQTRRRLKLLQVRQQNLDVQLDVTRVKLQRSLQSLAAQRAKLRARLRGMYKHGPARIVLAEDRLSYLLVHERESAEQRPDDDPKQQCAVGAVDRTPDRAARLPMLSRDVVSLGIQSRHR